MLWWQPRRVRSKQPTCGPSLAPSERSIGANAEHQRTEGFFPSRCSSAFELLVGRGLPALSSGRSIAQEPIPSSSRSGVRTRCNRKQVGRSEVCPNAGGCANSALMPHRSRSLFECAREPLRPARTVKADLIAPWQCVGSMRVDSGESTEKELIRLRPRARLQ